MKTKECGGPRCKQQIGWAVTKEGKRIPLDVSAPVYFVEEDNIQSGLPLAVRTVAYVNHYKTCPDADLFTKRVKGAKR